MKVRLQRRRGVALLGLLLLGLAATVLLAALTLGAAAAWYWGDLPPLDKATDYRPQQHLQVLTSDGVEIAQFGAERRSFVPIAEVPQRLRDAVLAVEDAGFYQHGGISWRGLARAGLANIGGGITGAGLQGASTITQQVARTFFLSTRRTPERKIKEALLALQLEARLSKDRIFELYLNQIYLGKQAYGFGAAAQVYFGKALADLSTAETALLAGLPQNPVYANPITSLKNARRRQQWVLQRMRKTGVISAAEEAQAAAETLVLRSPLRVDVHAQHVAEMARLAVVERLGDKAYTDGIRVITSLRADDQRAAHAALRRAVLAHERKQPWRGPEEQEALPDDSADADRAAALALKDQRDDEDLRVAIVMSAGPRELTARLTSGDTVTVRGDSLRWVQAALAPQAAARLALRRGSIVRLVRLVRLVRQVRQVRQGPGAAARANAPEWQLAQWPEAEAAFVALDPVSGRVRALVGGFDFNRRQFNHAMRAERQPGSSFKPFLYAAAFENGVMPETLVDDAPLTPADGAPPGWDPKNSDGHFDGEMTVREGLVRSKNLVSIRLLQHIGLDAARAGIARFGFDMAQQPQNLTLALGTGSVTPMQLTLAYAVLANGGHRVAPVLIERITDARGLPLYEAPPPEPLTEASRVLPARNAFLINTLLADVTRRGTAARAQAVLQRPDLYGKTGTTNDAVDAWFGGFAPGLAAVAWMGYDDPRSLGEGESGGGLALPIWIDSVARMLRSVPVQQPAAPEGVVAVGAEWRYAEWSAGGFLPRVVPADGMAGGPTGVPAGVPTSLPAPPAPASAPGSAPSPLWAPR